MLKRHLRTLIDHAASLSGLLRGFEKRMRRGLTVLMYHRVLPRQECAAYPLPSLAMPEDLFRQQVSWLAEHCRVLPIAEALDLAGQASDKPLISISFDDGYQDNARIARPILDAAGLRATFFVTTDFIRGKELWFDRALRLLQRVEPLYRVELATRLASEEAGSAPVPGTAATSDWMEFLKLCSTSWRHNYLDVLEGEAGATEAVERALAMSPEEISELARMGHEIGSHTLSHPILPQLEHSELERELTLSLELVREWSGRQSVGLAYPNGDSDTRVRKACASAGYAYAVTTRPGIFGSKSDPLMVPRRDITPGSVSNSSARFDKVAFRAELSSFHELMR